MGLPLLIKRGHEKKKSVSFLRISRRRLMTPEGESKIPLHHKTIKSSHFCYLAYRKKLVGGDWNHVILNGFPFFLGVE
jgi:hypothetical protein